MNSKIIWSILIVAAAALLVAGAVNRTMARSDSTTDTALASGDQQRRGQTPTAESTEAEGDVVGQAEGQGAGNGQGQAGGLGLAESDVNSLEQGAGNGRGQSSGEVQSQGAGNGNGNGNGQGGGNVAEADSARALPPDASVGAASGQGAGREPRTTEPPSDIAALERYQGTVTEVDDEHIVLVQSQDGATLEIEGRAWRFALENGFTVRVGDVLMISGYYDQDHFEPMEIANYTSGQQMQLREASGRPMWAGRGRGGGT